MFDIGILAGKVQESTSKPYPEYFGLLKNTALAELANSYLDNTRRLAGEKAYIVDSMPTNFQHIGMIFMLFKKADTILSLYLKL